MSDAEENPSGSWGGAGGAAALRGRIAVVGVAKNCGKTTTLNALLREREHEPVGLLSIGIDGEPHDLFIGTPKPSIAVHPGQWVISTEVGFQSSSARFEFVASLGFSTPMGAVSLARVREAGEVMLSGVRHGADLMCALEMMAEHGASPLFIDGAYGRVMGARSAWCDGVIVSTGAILSSSLDEVIAATTWLTQRLTREPPPEAWQRELLAQAMREERALLGTPDGEVTPLAARSALVGLSRSRALWTPAHRAIAVPGLVSDRVLEELLVVASRDDFDRRALLVPDGTSVQADAALMSRFERQWEWFAGENVALLGVSFNPTSLSGPGIDAERFEQALREAYGEGVWIFDPVRLG